MSAAVLSLSVALHALADPNCREQSIPNLKAGGGGEVTQPPAATDAAILSGSAARIDEIYAGLPEWAARKNNIWPRLYPTELIGCFMVAVPCSMRTRVGPASPDSNHLVVSPR